MTRRLLTIVLTACLTISTATAWAFWTAGSVLGGSGAAAASSVNQGATPTATAVAQAVTVSWAARTLTNGQAVNGYQVRRYDATTLVAQTILSSCTGTVAATTCVENSVPAGSWKYTVTPIFATNWLGPESATSTTVTVDTTSPTNSITRTAITGGSFKVADNVFYKGNAAGSVTLTNTLTDAGSGPASSATAALGGTTTGWSHTPSTVSTPAGGPYVSTAFSWTSGTTSGPTEVVTGRDVVGNSAPTTLTFINDSTAPNGGTISYTNGYQPGLSVPVTFNSVSDAGSGIASRWLQRASGPLTAGVCGSYTVFSNLGAMNPTSIYNDNAVSNGKCYKYQYVVTDNVGNTLTVTGANPSKIDYAGAVSATSGAYSYWRLGEALASSAMTDNIAVPANNNPVKSTPNNGTYGTSSTMGVAGAIAGDTNTAVQFDGQSPAYATAPRQLGGDFSFEFWFKSTQNFSTGNPACTSWWQGAGLIDADTGGSANDFGISLCAGKIIAGVGGGGPDVSVVTSGTYNNGAWHQVVFSRTQSSGAMALYVDGVPAGTATGSVNALTSTPTLHFGRGAAGTQYFSGSMDEVSLYNSVLSGATISGHYQSGTTAPDTTGPTGGSVDASGLIGTGSRYAASTTLSLALAKGTDPNGVATTGNLLQRASATLTSGGTADGTCGAFGAYATVTGGTDPASPKSDTVADQFCYRYQYVVLDTPGNPTTYTSPDIKVDRTLPTTPTLTHSAFTNTYWSSGAAVYYRSTASSGAFTTTATATDTKSGIASYAFAALGTNWTSTLGPNNVNTYSWSGAPAVPGAKSITATNNATLVSSGASFTPTVDNTAPTGGTVTYAGGVTTGASVSVSFASGTDALTGIGTRLLQRAAAPLTGTTCGTFGSFATVNNGTNPTSPLTDTITSGSCYKYQYVVADGVGNLATFTSATIVKAAATYSATILATSGLVSSWPLGEALSTSPMVDSKGTNNGTYFGAPTMGAAGAIAGSSDTAVQFNGTSQYATAARQISDDFSIEFWFKSSQSAGANCNQWWDGMRLVDAEVSGPNSDFGVSLCQGKIIGGVGSTNDVSIVSPLTYNNNAWHHVVFTRTMSPAAMQLYVDGALVIAGTPNNTGSLTASSTIALGRAAGGGSFYAGLLDEVAVYNSVLSAATISGHYQSGSTALDTTGPTGGSVAATGLVGTGSSYAASTTLSMVLAKGTDPSGVATTGNLLTRATATLTSGGTADGTCGTFGTYSTVATDPVSPKSDAVSDQACYSYKYVVLDTPGNPTTYTSPDVKVDRTAPTTPTLAHSAFTNTYWSSGTVVYYLSAASSGSFTTTATATDTKSGIASYAFPALGTNWTSTPSALGVNTYSWSGAPAAPGAKTITATNNAAVVSATASFTPTADNTAPSVGTVTPPDATQTSTSVSVAYTTGTDGGSGLGTRLLQRQSATLTGTTCGSYGGWTTAATNPGSSPFSDTVAGGFCYQYRYVVSDNVGNTDTATSGNVVKVSDTTPPSVTINQAAGQADPTSSGTMDFTATFSEPVTGFVNADVTVGGTATGAKTVDITGAGPVYTVTVSGMTGNGTIIASIGASIVQDLAGNNNTASTSTDNTVTLNLASSTVKAQYKNNDPAGPTNGAIQPGLQLVNTGASAVDLNTITVRYWFTKEAGASTFDTPCFWAAIDCAIVTRSVVSVTPRTGADSYLLVSFASYTLAAGASSGEMQLSINKTDWSAFNEVDDYSYGTGTGLSDSTTVTVYQGGTLIWGTEP